MAGPNFNPLLRCAVMEPVQERSTEKKAGLLHTVASAMPNHPTFRSEKEVSIIPMGSLLKSGEVDKAASASGSADHIAEATEQRVLEDVFSQGDDFKLRGASDRHRSRRILCLFYQERSDD